MSEEITFGKWLHQRRRRMDLTQQQLADQVSCARITLSRIESGTLKPSRELAMILLEKLGIAASERPKWLPFARGILGYPEETGKPSAKKSPNNLPVSMTSFVGREKERIEIAKLIGKHRLVTLTGSGGVGKTRLALEVGADLLDTFYDGVWFVELSSLENPNLVPQTILAVLGLVERQDKNAQEMLWDFLRPKKNLIILDNCEHLIEVCANLATVLLSHCSALKILATSSKALDIDGEMAWRVPPLASPDPANIPPLNEFIQYEAVRLFIDRASLANPNFRMEENSASAVAQICYHLDGIPLALELAAARVKVLSVDQISARLDDRFHLLTRGVLSALPRHQTLHALIEWSYNLLSEEERVLFCRLAVFAGGWTIEAAEAVCSGNNLKSYEILDILTNLVEKSLVITEDIAQQIHFRCLETIRQYTREKFLGTDEVEVIRNKHLAWILDWAKSIEPELHGRDQARRFDQIRIELDNIRVAMEWGLSSGQAETSMKIFHTLLAYWDGNNPYEESRRWLDRGISHRDQLSKNTLVSVLSDAAWLASRQNDLQRGIPFAEEALVLARELSDALLVSNCLRILSWLSTSNGQFEESNRYSEEAHDIYQELNDKTGLAYLVADRSVAMTYQGNLLQAVELLENNLNLLVGIEDRSVYAWFQYLLGGLKLLQGEFDKATEYLKNSVLEFRRIKNNYLISYPILAFGGVATGRNDPVRGARLFSAGESILESIGASIDVGFRPIFTLLLEQTKSMVDEGTFQSTWAEGKAMTMDQTIEFALEAAG
jgi:predicted ATPase/DNA-binding XRE family transcriptional regulator